MGDNRINTNPNTGTMPLRRPDGSPAPAPTPAQAANGAPAGPRDTARTGPLDPTQLPPDVNIDHIDVPAPPKEEHHGLWDKIKSGVSGAVHKAEHVVSDVVHTAEHVVEVGEHVVASGVHGFEEGRAHGEGLMHAMGDGLHAAEGTAFKEAADPLLNHAIGKADKANDKAAGALGPLLTNRLAVGDSVDIKIEAGATLPTELVGAPNVKLDGGGTLKIKRVAAVDANNKPILNPDGTQQTRLEVELKAEGRAGAAYSAKIGTSVGVSAAGHDLKLEAKAKAEAEAGLTGSLDMKLRFNPDDPKDMGDLLAMTKATAATGAAATIPGLGACIAAMSAEDYKRSFDTLGSHLEEVGGQGGLYAQANASAKVGAGIFKSAPPDGAEKQTGVVNTAIEQGHDAVLDKLQLQLAQAGVGVGANMNVGAKHNYRTGETIYSINVGASANAGASVLGAGEKGQVNGNRTINLVMGKDGKLKDITVQQSMSRDEFKGAMTTVADVYGRPIDQGVIAGLQTSDKVTVNYHIKPDLVAQMRNAHDIGALGQAALAVSSAAITKDRFKLDPGDIVTDHRQELDFKFDVGAALGAEIDIRGGITLGHDQERVLN